MSLKAITTKALVLVLVVVIILAAVVALFVFRPAEAPPEEEKIIFIGVTDKITDLDPANAYDFFTWEVLNNIMEGLVKYELGTLEIVPGLAESWTELSWIISNCTHTGLGI